MVNYCKTAFLSLAILAIFWLVLETGARFALFVKTGSSVYLKYGFRKTEKDENRFEKVFDSDGRVLYYTCARGSEKNPVNRLGLRGHDIAAQKTALQRVICLGGSTTFGLSLDYADSYPEILQKKLDAQCGPGRYEVINAGVPGHQLPHIIQQVQHVLAPLHPDIIILMSVFNNLVSDERDFAFIAIEGDEKNTAGHYFSRLVAGAKKYSVLVTVADDIAKKGLKNYLKNVNWEKGAAAIMRSRNVWNGIADNLHTLFNMLTEADPGVTIFVLDEPMNIIDYPELSAPMEKAYQVQQDVSSRYPAVRHLALMPFFNEAQKARKKIWLSPYHDPIHLSRAGNELLAEIICKEIMALSDDMCR